MTDNIVEINNVSMMFNMSSEKIDNLKEYVVKLLKRQLSFQEFWALKDITLSIKRGESLGIIGLNGSGKSTLLKIIAGVLKPTQGKVNVYGSISPLIELGAGFDFELSARENIFLNGAILGYSKQDMQNKFDEIVDFAELRDFLDMPIKNFSSGMTARLGFAIATITKPDILIVDEILGVGDFKFQEKCEKRMDNLINGGTTVILVTHAASQIEKICHKAVWIEKGTMRMYGDVHPVLEAYLSN